MTDWLSCMKQQAAAPGDHPKRISAAGSTPRSGLLAAEGYHGLSISAVATRAGVPRSTLYRRGHTKASLAVDAITLGGPADPRTHRRRSARRPDPVGVGVPAGLRRRRPLVIMELHAHALHDDQLAEPVADYLRPRGALLDRMIGRAIDAGAVDESLDAACPRPRTRPGSSTAG